MNEILDVNQPEANYIGFWPRLGALLIDGLIIGIPLAAATFYNILYLKSTILLIALSIIGASYKPVMEALYGATIGKKVLNIKVVNIELTNIGWKESLLRNIFNLLSSTSSLIVSVMLFTSAGFEAVASYSEYAIYASEFSSTSLSLITGLLFIVDAIFMLTDDRKRTLHDRIANTYVVYNPSKATDDI